MERKLIYRDQRTIDSVLAHYRKAVPVLQSAINDLKAEGISLTDETLADLVKGGTETRAQIETEIRKEVGKLRFRVLKKELEETLAPLLEKVSEAVSKVSEAMIRNSVSEHVVLDLSDFTCNDLTVGLVADLEDRITERHTLWDTDPAVAQAHKLACELRDKHNELEAYLRKHGDALHPISKNPVIIREEVIAYGVTGLIRIDGHRAELNDASFASMHWRLP